MGVPHPAPRQQRGALLPARGRARRRDAADRLHPDGGDGDPGVQPSVPPPPRRLPEYRGRRRHRPGAGLHRTRTGRRRPGRRLRRRGDPRHRRLGRRRDRHLDRQARRLHGRGRHRPEPGPGGGAGRGHEPRVAAERPALSRPAPLQGPRREVRRLHRRLRRQRVHPLPEGDPALGGLLRPARAGGSWRATETPCAPSTTTSRARRRSAWPVRSPGSASRVAAWSTSRSWSSAQARPVSGSPT